MFTSADKAIVAIIMGLVFLVNTYFGLGINVDPNLINTIVALVTPLLVYIVPNKTNTPSN